MLLKTEKELKEARLTIATLTNNHKNQKTQGKKKPCHTVSAAENSDLDGAIPAYARLFAVMEQLFLYPDANYFLHCHLTTYADRKHFKDLADGNTLVHSTFEAVWHHIHSNMQPQLKNESFWTILQLVGQLCWCCIQFTREMKTIRSEICNHLYVNAHCLLSHYDGHEYSPALTAHDLVTINNSNERRSNENIQGLAGLQDDGTYQFIAPILLGKGNGLTSKRWLRNPVIGNVYLLTWFYCLHWHAFRSLFPCTLVHVLLGNQHPSNAPWNAMCTCGGWHQSLLVPFVQLHFLWVALV